METIANRFAINGSPATYAGFSEFSLLDKFVNGVDIIPLFNDRNDVLSETSNSPFVRTLRVFSMANSFMQLHPSQYEYSSITALTDFALEHGFIIDWECLADCQIIMPKLEDQLKHWEKMNSALEGHECLLSLGNEWRKNGFKPEDFDRQSSLLVSRGSDLGGNYPYIPEWDYSDYHTRRDEYKGLAACGRYLVFVVGQDLEASPKWYGLENPVVVKEWLGAADNMEPGRRTNRPSDHYRAGLDMAMWCAGGTFHSDCGILSNIFTDRQRECAKTFFMGLSKPDPVQGFDGSLGY